MEKSFFNKLLFALFFSLAVATQASAFSIYNYGPCPIEVYDWSNEQATFLAFVGVDSGIDLTPTIGQSLRITNTQPNWADLEFDVLFEFNGQPFFFCHPNYCIDQVHFINESNCELGIYDSTDGNANLVATVQASSSELVVFNEGDVIQLRDSNGTWPTHLYLEDYTVEAGLETLTIAPFQCSLDISEASPLVYQQTTPPTQDALSLPEVQNWLNNHGGASSQLPGVTWTYIWEAIQGAGCPTGPCAQVIFVADYNGAYSEETSTVVIPENFNPPVITDAQDEVMNCSATYAQYFYQAWLDDNGMATTSESNITWVNELILDSVICGASNLKRHEFFAFNEFGSFSSTTADFLFEDLEAPHVNLFAHQAHFACVNGSVDVSTMEYWLGENLVVEVTDNCNDLSTINAYYDPSQINCGLYNGFPLNIEANDGCNTATTSVLVEANNEFDCDGTSFCLASNNYALICPEFCDLSNAFEIVEVQTIFNCSINLLEQGCIRYLPLPAFLGNETLQIIACDTINPGLCDTVIVQINVAPDCDVDCSNESLFFDSANAPPYGDFLLGEQEHFRTDAIIEANNVIGSGADIIYDAGDSVILQSGFTIESGALFEIRNEGCP